MRENKFWNYSITIGNMIVTMAFGLGVGLVVLLFALIAYHANSHVLSVNDTIPLNDSIPPANEILNSNNSTNGWAPNLERMLLNYTPVSPSASELSNRCRQCFYSYL